MSCERLEQLSRVELPGGLRVYRAETPHSRLLGLSLLEEVPSHHALLIPRCRSIHTFGMRFPIDAVFLDRRGRAVWIEEELAPRRVAGVLAAEAVLETRAGHANRFLAAGAGALAARVRRPRRPVAVGPN